MIPRMNSPLTVFKNLFQIWLCVIQSPLTLSWMFFQEVSPEMDLEYQNQPWAESYNEDEVYDDSLFDSQWFLDLIRSLED